MSEYAVCSTGIPRANTTRGLWGEEPWWRAGSRLCLERSPAGTPAEGIRWRMRYPHYSDCSPLSPLSCLKPPRKCHCVSLAVTAIAAHHPPSGEVTLLWWCFYHVLEITVIVLRNCHWPGLGEGSLCERPDGRCRDLREPQTEGGSVCAQFLMGGFFTCVFRWSSCQGYLSSCRIL